MIDLVLNARRQNTLRLDLADFVVAVEIAHLDPVRTLDLGIMFRQRQTTFFVYTVVVGDFDDLRVGERDRLGLFVLARDIDDDDAALVADLRRRQADPCLLYTSPSPRD